MSLQALVVFVLCILGVLAAPPPAKTPEQLTETLFAWMKQHGATWRGVGIKTHSESYRSVLAVEHLKEGETIIKVGSRVILLSGDQSMDSHFAGPSQLDVNL